MAIKVITFDLDNTLWDVEPALIQAERAQYDWLQQNRPKVCAEFSIRDLYPFRQQVLDQHPQLRHQISEIRKRALYDVQVHCGYSPESAETGAGKAFAVFLHWRQQVVLYEQAVDVLEQLAQQYILGALTNGNADIFKTDLGDHFDFAFTAEQVNASKPLPDLFEAAQRASEAQPDQMVHVGDNPEHDVAGAQLAGLHTVWMNSREKQWPEGQPRADVEITLIGELPQAVARIAALAGE